MHLSSNLQFPTTVQPIKPEHSAYRTQNVAAPIYNPAKRASGSGFGHLKKCGLEALLVPGSQERPLRDCGWQSWLRPMPLRSTQVHPGICFLDVHRPGYHGASPAGPGYCRGRYGLCSWPRHGRGWSTDEAGPYFLLEPLRCFRCHVDFCPSVLNRSWDLFGRN